MSTDADSTPGKVDSHGRVDYLRVSVTDRCNLRCTYCMPLEGVPPRSHADILRYEELVAFVGVAATCGISKVRITGGEPLVRRGCVDFVATLAGTSGIVDISLTTNGILLPRFAADLRRAGLRRVNMSLDSLNATRFAAITRCGTLADALAGLEAAFAAGFSPIKINVVLLEGIEDELEAFVKLAREREVHVRFIEFMPLDRRPRDQVSLVPASGVLACLKEHHDLEPHAGPYGHGPAQYWQEPGAQGTIGFIAGVSEHFCGSCNRLRLTADGRLRTCLFSGDEIAVRPLIGHPEELRRAITGAVSGKRYDRCLEQLAGERAMSQIGG